MVGCSAVASVTCLAGGPLFNFNDRCVFSDGNNEPVEKSGDGLVIFETKFFSSQES